MEQAIDALEISFGFINLHDGLVERVDELERQFRILSPKTRAESLCKRVSRMVELKSMVDYMFNTIFPRDHRDLGLLWQLREVERSLRSFSGGSLRDRIKFTWCQFENWVMSGDRNIPI